MKEELKKLLDPLDSIEKLECDGLTRAAAYLLHRENIEHQVWVGTITYKEKPFYPHFWITVGDDLTVDYRIRRWFDDSAPHGVIEKANLKDVVYAGDPVELTPNPALYELLTGRNAYDDDAKETTT